MQELLVRVFPPALRRYVGNGALQYFQQRLLHAFSAYVPGNGGIIRTSGNLVDFVHVDNTLLRLFHVPIRRLKKFQQDIFNVLAYVARFCESGGVRNGKGNVQNLC